MNDIPIYDYDPLQIAANPDLRALVINYYTKMRDRVVALEKLNKRITKKAVSEAAKEEEDAKSADPVGG